MGIRVCFFQSDIHFQKRIVRRREGCTAKCVAMMTKNRTDLPSFSSSSKTTSVTQSWWPWNVATGVKFSYKTSSLSELMNFLYYRKVRFEIGAKRLGSLLKELACLLTNLAPDDSSSFVKLHLFLLCKEFYDNALWTKNTLDHSASLSCRMWRRYLLSAGPEKRTRFTYIIGSDNKMRSRRAPSRKQTHSIGLSCESICQNSTYVRAVHAII